MKFATSEAKEGTSAAASSSAKDDDDDDNSVTEKDGYVTTTRSRRHVFRPERLGQAVNANIDMLSNAELNYYAALAETDESEVALVGAAMGGGFQHTSELKPMNYKEAMDGPEAEEWKAEVENEHNRMVKYQVWEAVPKSEVPKEAKKIDTAWAMKKKSNGTKRGRVNARGFKQVDGEHYDSSSIAAPVASDGDASI